MKSSIRKQFSLIFIGLFAGTILLCWLMNSLFLEKYYVNSKINVIYDAYQTISEAAASDEYDSAVFQDQLNSICSNSNIKVCVLDSNSQQKYESINGGEKLQLRLIGYLFGFPMDEVHILQQGSDYCIQQSGNPGNEFIEMYGRLSSGISFIMQTPLESIRESADIANRFFFYMGCLCCIAGGVLIWFISKRITKPILKLNQISERMVHLDFEAKYYGNAHNEIDLLGENINILSESLEKSISELKTANNELKKDIEKKEQIDEMRKEFLSNVSHELKTPIALIQGYAEGLQEGINDDSESKTYYCEVIIDEAAKMNNMVKKLLTLNQLEAGNDIVNMERFDITALIVGCLQSAEILIKQNDIEIRYERSQPIYVWADEFKIEEVFMNYLSNAINHCKDDKYIEINTVISSGKVRVSVFNTGDPIPEESLSQVWDKFYKVDKARTREYGGNGIGLSIVKAIMESLNQGYGVNNYSNGVLFWFELDTKEAITMTENINMKDDIIYEGKDNRGKPD